MNYIELSFEHPHDSDCPGHASFASGAQLHARYGWKMVQQHTPDTSGVAEVWCHTKPTRFLLHQSFAELVHKCKKLQTSNSLGVSIMSGQAIQTWENHPPKGPTHRQYSHGASKSPLHIGCSLTLQTLRDLRSSQGQVSFSIIYLLIMHPFIDLDPIFHHFSTAAMSRV